MLKYEEYLSKSLCGNLKSFMDKQVELLTLSHLGYAEILGDIGEIFSYLNSL